MHYPTSPANEAYMPLADTLQPITIGSADATAPEMVKSRLSGDYASIPITLAARKGDLWDPAMDEADGEQ
jgi:hypothetical protein